MGARAKMRAKPQTNRMPKIQTQNISSPGKKTQFPPRSGFPVRPLYKLDLPMPGR